MRQGRVALVCSRGLEVNKARPKSRSPWLLYCLDMWIILGLGCLVEYFSGVDSGSLARIFRDKDGRKGL